MINLTCPFCKSKNVIETEFSKYTSYRKRWSSDGYTKLYNCNECGFHGNIINLLEIRKIKLKKIKERI